MAEQEPLFRREVLSSRSAAGLGSVLVARPLSTTVMVWIASIAILGILALLRFGEYTKSAQLSGYLIPERGLVEVYPTQPGLVTRVAVREGQEVRRGEVLYHIAEKRTTLGGEVSHQKLDLLGVRKRSLENQHNRKAALAQTRHTSLLKKRELLRQELQHLEQEIVLRQRLEKEARLVYGRYEELYEKGVVSFTKLKDEKSKWLQLEARLADLQRSESQIERGIEDISSELSELPLRTEADQENIQREILSLEQEMLEAQAQRETLVLAPIDGFVTNAIARPGQWTSDTAVLASIVPHDSVLEAHLYASSRAIGFIKKAQEVSIRYESFPYQKYGRYQGEVKTVSRSALPAAPRYGTKTQGSEPVYLVTVSLAAQFVNVDGRREALQPNMKVAADVFLDRRTLWEWIFEPILKFKS